MPDPTPPAVPPVVPPVEPPAPPAPPTTPPAPPAPPPKNDNTFKVPEQYAKEPWAQAVKSPEELWQQLANAQTLIGKKEVLKPWASATPEEKKQYLKEMGVPDAPEAYQFKTIEVLKDRQRDANLDNKTKVLLQKHDIPKDVGEAPIHDLELTVFEFQKPLLDKRAETEKAYSQLVAVTFGDKAPTAMAQFEDVIEQTLDKDTKHVMQKFKSLAPEAKTVAIALSKAIHDKFIGEHKIKNPPPPPPGGGSGDLKKDYKELSSTKQAVRADTTIPQHVKDQRLAELNRQMREVGAKADAAGIDLFS